MHGLFGWVLGRSTSRLSDPALLMFWHLFHWEPLPRSLSSPVLRVRGISSSSGFPFLLFLSHHYAPHIWTSKTVLGLDFNRNLHIISSAYSVPLLQSTLHILKRWMASLSCSEIFSDPLLLRICHFSFTALRHEVLIWLLQSLEGNSEVHQHWSESSLVPPWSHFLFSLLSICCDEEHTIYSCSQDFLESFSS